MTDHAIRVAPPKCAAGKLTMKMQPKSLTQLDFMPLLQGIGIASPAWPVVIIMPPAMAGGAALAPGTAVRIVALT